MLFCSIYNPNPVFTSITVTGLTPAGLVKNSVAGLLSTEAFGTSTYIPYSSGTGFSYSANLTFAADVLATTEINIGAIGSTGTKLAIGTNSTTETYPGIIEIVSDSTHLFTTSAGLVVDAFFSPNPTPVFSMAGYFNNASAGSYITTGKTYLGLYGGTNVSLDITNTASARGLNIQGLQFSAYNNADMSKSLGLLTSFITIWGMLLTSSFGYAGKTISGSKITETAHCSELQSTIAGTYNATQAGNNYGERITVVDSLEAASTGNVTSYGLHITVPATVTKAGGGVLTSWGIYEASQVDNLFYGNVRIGSLVAPTVALDVTGAGLFSTTLGVTGLITATGGITIGAGSTTVWPLRFTSGPFLTTPVAGTMEFYNDKIYITNVANRKSIDRTGEAKVTTTTVANSNTEDTVFTEVIAANTLKAGNIIKIKAFGQYTTASASDTFNINVYIGTTLIGTIASPAGIKASNAPWHSESILTIRTAGAGGTVSSHIDMIAVTSSSHTNTPTTAINTTNANDITVKIQWSAAKADNIAQIDQAFVEFKN